MINLLRFIKIWSHSLGFDIKFYNKMTKTVTVSRQAYGKIFLHAAKCFDGLVLGFILGQMNGDEVTVSNVLSVCHANPAGPILDIAGDTVGFFAKKLTL